MKTTNRNKGKKTEGNVIYKPSYFSVRERIPEDFIEERMSFNELDDYRYYNCDNERGKYPIFFIKA